MAITRTKSVTDTKDKAQKFIDRLLSEGSKVTCDETNPHFSRSFDLPEFYDEELFKKGQQFFYKHLAGMFFSKLQGLLVVLLIPTILKILIMTKMSGSTMTAYRRYIATIFHMMIWYDKDFKPGSDLWKSVAEVRKLHNSASKKGKSCSLNHISQMDMALTQFGFMGFALVRSRKVGIHNATDEEWASFIHVWRVIGHLLGIEDRFNMCGGTVDETRQISKLLIPRVYKPLIEKRDKDFLEMTYYLTDGLWCFLPILQYESLLSYNYGLLSIEDDTTEMKPLYFQLQGYAIFNFGFLKWLMEMSKYTWLRLCINFILSSRLWLSRWLPFLAFYSFGVSNSYVKLRLKDDTSPQFNLCTGSVRETKQICNDLIRHVFKPLVDKRDAKFLAMCNYLIQGLWFKSPLLQYESCMNYMHGMLSINDDMAEIKPKYLKSGWYGEFNIRIISFITWLLQFKWYRVFHNSTIDLALWLMKVFPFLAICYFGFSNAYVELNLKSLDGFHS